MKKSQLFLVMVILLMTSSICPAVAAEAENKINPWKKFGFNLGGSFNLNDSRVQLGKKNLGVYPEKCLTPAMLESECGFRLSNELK